MKTTTLVLLCIVHYSLSIAQISSLTKSKQKIWNLYEQKEYPACLKTIDSLTKINTKRFPFLHLLAARCYIKLDKKKDASRKLTDAFASGLIEDFNTDTSFLFEYILVDSIEIEFIRKEISEKGVDLFKTFQSNLNQPLIETINKIKYSDQNIRKYYLDTSTIENKESKLHAVGFFDSLHAKLLSEVIAEHGFPKYSTISSIISAPPFSFCSCTYWQMTVMMMKSWNILQQHLTN